jgi:hypothetical protein
VKSSSRTHWASSLGGISQSQRSFSCSLPDVDREVALKLIDQVPEITALARVVLDDAAKAYDAALTSNDRSQENVHQIHLKHLEILQAELQKDLTPEEWIRVLEDMKDVNLSAAAKDTENKRFIAAQLHTKLATGAVIFLGVIALVFAGGRSSHSLSN